MHFTTELFQALNMQRLPSDLGKSYPPWVNKYSSLHKSLPTGDSASALDNSSICTGSASAAATETYINVPYTKFFSLFSY